MSTCKSTTHSYGPVPGWTSKSTSTWMFNALSAPLDSKDIKRVRPSVQLAQSTGVEGRPALRMSNDGNAWDAPIAIGTLTRNTDGTAYGDDFVDVSTTTKAKQLCQLGVELRNNSGAAVEMAMVSGKFDVEGD